MRHNKSHVCTGTPSANWKCSTPSKANAFGNRHLAHVILQVQPRQSSLLPRNFLGVAAALSTALWSVPFIAHPCASVWVTELSSSTCLHSIPKHCSASQHLTAAGGAVLACPLWDLFSGRWDSVWSMGSEPAEKCYTMQAPTAPVGFAEVNWLLIFVLRDDDLHSQQICISIHWVEIGIKPVQRGEICWGEW